MKIIIVGIGNFGGSLAIKLSEAGHEIIAVDDNMSKLDAIKDRITQTVQLDATDIEAIKNLPVKEADLVVIAIGENFGSSVMTTAIFKQLHAKKIISRSISTLHHTVVDAIGVDEIVSPEQESAERLAKKISMTSVVDSFKLSDDYSIVEIKLPIKFENKTINEMNFREEYGLNVVTVLRLEETKNIFGKTSKENKAIGVPTPETKLIENDVLVVFGLRKDIDRFINNHCQ